MITFLKIIGVLFAVWLLWIVVIGKGHASPSESASPSPSPSPAPDEEEDSK